MIHRALGIIRKSIVIGLAVAAVATALLWLNSWHRPRSWTWYAPKTVQRAFNRYGASTQKRLHLVAGRIYIRHFELMDGSSPPGKYSVEFGGFRWSTSVSRPNPIQPSRQGGWDPLFGLSTEERREARALSRKQVWNLDLRVPFWAPCILFATSPAIAFIGGPLRRWRRRRRGVCAKCGYDLTGNVSGVCPECGRKVEAP